MISVTSPFERVIEKEAMTEWTPTKKQGQLLALPFDIDEAGYGGALMAGKSDVLMIMPLVYGFHEYPKFKGLFLRRTFPELEQEIIPRSQEFYPSTGAIYNIAKHRWEFPAGGMDIFGHVKDEKDVKKYDTGQFNPIRFDEATSFTPFQYEYLVLRRNRSAVGFPFPAFSRWGSNPGNVGHMYFRKRFIDPCKQGGKIIRDSKTGSKRIFIPATAQDNPHGLLANPKYFQRLQGISSEAERRAMILGDWYTFEGQVFEEFRLEPLPDEPNNARHVIEPFSIPSWWPKIIGIDWGFSAYTFVIWAAISPDGRVFIYRAYAVKKAKIKVWSREIGNITGNEIPQVRDIRICHSAVQDIGQDQTLFDQVAEALEDSQFTCSLTKGEKNRVGGKQLVHEYLRWKPIANSFKEIIGEYDQELANKIYRTHGDAGLQQYIKYFEIGQPEHNIPRLLFFNKTFEGNSECDKALDLLIETVPSCVYDEVKKEDVKEFDGDDPYDCLRILLYAVRDYFDDSRNEHEKHEQIGLAAKSIKVGEDQTDFYRVCERIEAEKKEIFSIRKRANRMSGMSRSTRAVGYRTRAVR